jgi:outer membrane protein
LHAFRRDRPEAPLYSIGPREKEILDLQKRIEADRARFDKERDKLPPAELKARGNAIADMMRKSDQMAVAIAEDLERRKGELRVTLVEDAGAAIKVIAEAGKFDLIVQEAIYRRPAIDVTEQVLKEMARRAGAARK